MSGKPAISGTRSAVNSRKERALLAASKSIADAGASRTSARRSHSVRQVRRGGPAGEGNSAPKAATTPMLAITCLGNVLGTLLFIFCVAVFWGSGEMVQVLHGICTDEFTASSDRIAQYQDFFSNLGKGKFSVNGSKPDILGGEINYAWSVQVPNSAEVRAFCWKHDIQENVITPMGNPALCLDVALGFITPQEAQQYGFYDPDDQVTQAIVRNNMSLLNPVEIAGPPAPGLPEGPVGAPVRTPEEAARRGYIAKAKTEEEAKAKDETGAEEPGQATEVDAGDGTGGDKGGGDAGGGEGNGQDVHDPGQY